MGFLQFLRISKSLQNQKKMSQTWNTVSGKTSGSTTLQLLKALGIQVG